MIARKPLLKYPLSLVSGTRDWNRERDLYHTIIVGFGFYDRCCPLMRNENLILPVVRMIGPD